MPKREELIRIKFLAQRWVYLDKPNSIEFSKQVEISRKKVKEIMNVPFWNTAVMHAEHERAAKSKKMENAPSGKRLPKHLLDQAVFLWLGGWSFREIERAINRKPRTLEYWIATSAWQEAKERIMIDKLKMHLLNRNMTIQDLLKKIKGDRHD